MLKKLVLLYIARNPTIMVSTYKVIGIRILESKLIMRLYKFKVLNQKEIYTGFIKFKKYYWGAYSQNPTLID